MTRDEIAARILRLQHRYEPTPVVLALKAAAEKCQDKVVKNDNARR